MTIKGYGQANVNAISQFEDTIGFALPEDYKQFLQNYNGGSARKNNFYVPGLQETISLNVFFGLDVDRRLDLRTWYNDYRRDLLPQSVIIAHDPGTGIIVLINRPDVKGVYYWDHAHNFPQTSEKLNTYKIAGSFQEFIDGLKTPETV